MLRCLLCRGTNRHLATRIRTSHLCRVVQSSSSGHTGERLSLLYQLHFHRHSSSRIHLLSRIHPRNLKYVLFIHVHLFKRLSTGRSVNKGIKTTVNWGEYSFVLLKGRPNLYASRFSDLGYNATDLRCS